MGDRGNIAFIDRCGSMPGSTGYTFLYTHWSGSSIGEILQETLKRRHRWDDTSYLCRMVFCELVKGSETEETGFGISPFMGDNEHVVLLVDCDNHQVSAHREEDIREAAIAHILVGSPIRTWTFEEFASLEGSLVESLMHGLWNLGTGLPEEGE